MSDSLPEFREAALPPGARRVPAFAQGLLRAISRPALLFDGNAVCVAVSRGLHEQFAACAEGFTARPFERLFTPRDETPAGLHAVPAEASLSRFRAYLHGPAGERWSVRLSTRSVGGHGLPPLTLVYADPAADEPSDGLLPAGLGAERLARIVEATTDGLWDWDFDSGEVLITPQFEALLGYAPGELARDHDGLMSVVHPDDAPAIEQALRSHVETGAAYDIDLRLRTRELGYRWFRSRARMLAEHERPSRLVGTLTDIHEITLTRQGREGFIRRSLRQRAVLSRFDRDPTLQDIDVEQALPQLATAIADALEVHRVNVWQLTDDNRGLLQVHNATRDEPPPPSSRPERPGMSIPEAVNQTYFEAILQSRVVVFDDVATDSRLEGPLREYLAPLGVGAMLDAPILIAGRTVGVLCCEHVGGPRAWAEDELSFVASAAAHIARLFVEQERRTFREALAESERQFEAMFEQSAVGLVQVGFDRRILRANRKAADMLGVTVDALVGRNLGDFQHPAEPTCPQRMAMMRGDIDEYRAEKRFVTTAGDTRQFEMHASLMRTRDGEPRNIILALNDVTERHMLSYELYYQATHDLLTNLINRREFERRLSELVESRGEDAVSHTLCYIDLDQFKVVNDTCGHQAGDALLGQLTALLARAVPEDAVLARLGGDEFGLLLRACTPSQAVAVGERLLHAISEIRFQWEGRVFTVAASVGMVTVRPSDTDPYALLSAADAACYEAKEAGRNRIHFHDASEPAVPNRVAEMSWAATLTDALDTNRFVLYRQTIERLDRAETGEHYELLVRMKADDGTIVPPGEFLPAAERYGLSQRIDRWVISHYLQWLSDHPEALERLNRCAINLSAHSLSNPAFRAWLMDTFRAHPHIPMHRIGFEITESVAITRLADANQLFQALGRHGCTFALDDFGTGMSSFAYLQTMPVDYVKIDGTFVRDATTNSVNRAIIGAISQVAREMGKRTVAEFVETDDIRACVKALGVHYAQGYGIARPCPL